jgi:hypothetical protein
MQADSKISRRFSPSVYNQSNAFNSTYVSTQSQFQSAASNLIQNSLVTLLQKKAEEMANMADIEVMKRTQIETLSQQQMNEIQNLKTENRELMTQNHVFKV